MNGPRYIVPQTREEQFQEAYDRYSFERDLEAGIICSHGDDPKKCPMWHGEEE